MDHLPGHHRASIVVPYGIARRMCSRARDEWGHDAAEEKTGAELTRVRMWLGNSPVHRHDSRGDKKLFGAFTVRWGNPGPALATIDNIEWDPSQGASEMEIRHAVDHLAGWPVATLEKRAS